MKDGSQILQQLNIVRSLILTLGNNWPIISITMCIISNQFQYKYPDNQRVEREGRQGIRGKECVSVCVRDTTSDRKTERERQCFATGKLLLDYQEDSWALSPSDTTGKPLKLGKALLERTGCSSLEAEKDSSNRVLHVTSYSKTLK